MAKMASKIADVDVTRVGKGSSGAQFVEIHIPKGGRAARHFFSTRELTETDARVAINWAAEEGFPLISRADKSQFQQLVSERVKKALADRKLPNVHVCDEHGWNGDAFVTKYAIHSPGDGPVVSSLALLPLKRHRRDARSIKDMYRRYGHKNPLVIFASCLSFLGPLLRFLGTGSLPWFWFWGETSSGKSTLLNWVAAPWGGEPKDSIGLLESLWSTEHAPEDLTQTPRDQILAFDDSKANSSNSRRRADELIQLINRLTAGQGKGRSKKYQDRPKTWRTPLAAASNETFSELMVEAGKERDPATLVRAIEVPCANAFGIFDRVPPGGAKQFVQAMLEESLKLRGLAGELLIARLVEEHAAQPIRLKARLSLQRAGAERRFMTAGQDRAGGRVAEKFAQVYAAGSLASDYGVLPWSRRELLNAVTKVYRRHRSSLAETQTQSDATMVLRQFLSERRGALLRIKEGHPRSLRSIRRAAGVRYRLSNGTVEYCFLPEQFNRIFRGGLSIRSAVVQLCRAGCLKTDSGVGGDGSKLRPKRRFVRGRRSRVFCIDRDAIRARS